MADRIYTQADYDKVTDLYNEYQTKRDSYTPEQQQQIENAFGNAWSTMSNRIIESNNRVVDMWNDEQGNSWQMYGDGRKEMVNAAPTPQPAPTQQKARRRTPEVPTNNDEELYGLGGYLKEDTQAWEQQKNNPPTPEQSGYTAGPITGIQLGNPYTTPEGFSGNSIIPDALKGTEYGTGPITGMRLEKPYITPDGFSGNSIIPDSAKRTQGLLTAQWMENAQDRLSKYSPQFQADIKRILSSGGNISADGFVHRADGSVVTKI